MVERMLGGLGGTETIDKPSILLKGGEDLEVQKPHTTPGKLKKPTCGRWRVRPSFLWLRFSAGSMSWKGGLRPALAAPLQALQCGGGGP